MVAESSNAKISSDANGKRRSGVRRRSRLSGTIGELRRELRVIDQTIAELTRLSAERKTKVVIEIRPRIVGVERTDGPLDGSTAP
jgi:hypothetical protein